MTDAFDRCLSVTLGHEGGDTITDHPADPGGLTRWGISAAAHPGVDIRNLTRELAAEIYRREYWDRLQCSEMPLPIALLVFDSGVNQGTRMAAKFLQRTIGTAPDGIVGPRTLAAAWKKPTPRVIRGIARERLEHYTSLGGWRTFGKGWTNRLIDCAITATEWEHEDA